MNDFVDINRCGTSPDRTRTNWKIRSDSQTRQTPICSTTAGNCRRGREQTQANSTLHKYGNATVFHRIRRHRNQEPTRRSDHHKLIHLKK